MEAELEAAAIRLQAAARGNAARDSIAQGMVAKPKPGAVAANAEALRRIQKQRGFNRSQTLGSVKSTAADGAVAAKGSTCCPACSQELGKDELVGARRTQDAKIARAVPPTRRQAESASSSERPARFEARLYRQLSSSTNTPHVAPSWVPVRMAAGARCGVGFAFGFCKAYSRVDWRRI